MAEKGLAAKKKKAEAVCAVLWELYPDSACSLHFDGDPFRLLVSARLSAQCTDARVNIVTKELFSRFPDAAAMANASVEEIENIIRPCGLFRMKAHNIKDSAEMLMSQYGGTVPSDMDALLALPGVGRKIANLIRGDYFGLGGIVADTHCIRISNRLGLADRKDPVAVERALDPIVPKEKQSAFCHRLVDFGRDRCRAQNPLCNDCPLASFCGAHICGATRPTPSVAF